MHDLSNADTEVIVNDHHIALGNALAVDEQIHLIACQLVQHQQRALGELEDLLHLALCALYEAVDGADAVEKYDELKPDLVIMDITMPNMDGLEALKAIRGKDGSASVVMCSAMGQESMVMDAVRSGAKDFIVKPFKPDRVLKTVNTILGG